MSRATGAGVDPGPVRVRRIRALQVFAPEKLLRGPHVAREPEQAAALDVADCQLGRSLGGGVIRPLTFLFGPGAGGVGFLAEAGLLDGEALLALGLHEGNSAEDGERGDEEQGATDRTEVAQVFQDVQP